VIDPHPGRSRRAAAHAVAVAALATVLGGLTACRAADDAPAADGPTAGAPTAAALSPDAPAAPAAVASGAPTTATLAASAAVTDALGAAPEVVDHGDPTAHAAITAAQLKLAQAEAFRIRQSTTTINQTLPMTLTFAGPDRYSMVTPGMHAVRIGAEGWFRAGDAWQADPTVVSTLAAAFAPLRDPVEIDRASRRIADARDLGTSTVNGIEAQHYGYRVTDRTTTTVFTQTFEVWVGLADGRILVQQVDSEASGVTSRSAQLVEYGPDITVEGPPGR